MAKDFNIVGEGRNQLPHAACCWRESDRWHGGWRVAVQARTSSRE